MQRLVLIALYLLVSLVATAGDTTQVFKGAVSRHALFNEPGLNRWFLNEYTKYQPDFNTIEKLRSGLNKQGHKQITVVFGSWCPDSQLELPRLVKVLDVAGFDTADVTFVAVDRSKTSPDSSITNLGVKYVPTAIIYSVDAKGIKEIGRIAEHPAKSYEADLVRILRRLKN